MASTDDNTPVDMHTPFVCFLFLFGVGCVSFGFVVVIVVVVERAVSYTHLTLPTSSTV